MPVARTPDAELSRLSRPETQSRVAVVSHAEDTEGGRRDGRVECCRDAEGERVAGLERIEDAVVPEARGGVVGAALGLVLGERRGGELLALLGRHRLAARLELLELDGEQRLRRLLAPHDGDAAVRPREEE